MTCTPRSVAAYLALLCALLLHAPRPTASFVPNINRPKATLYRNLSTARSKSSLFQAPGENTNANKDVTSSSPPSELDEVLEVKIEGNPFIQTTLITLLPFVFTITSFFTFPFTSNLYHNAAEFLSRTNWEAVDGGELQWEILLPPLNGVVMTAISILFANLISTTFVSLRSRQEAVHQSLNTETEDIRGLINLIDFYPENTRELFRSYLRRYIVMVLEELQPSTNIASIRVKNNYPILDYLNNLHGLAVSKDDGEDDTMNPAILQQSYEAVQRIIAGRSDRVTALQSSFPTLHYLTIASLVFAMLLVFLMETDRDLILFLNKFQIRLIWSILIGTFTAIYCIGYDLSQPFVGTYQVPEILDEGDPIITNLFEGKAFRLRK